MAATLKYDKLKNRFNVCILYSKISGCPPLGVINIYSEINFRISPEFYRKLCNSYKYVSVKEIRKVLIDLSFNIGM